MRQNTRITRQLMSLVLLLVLPACDKAKPTSPLIQGPPHTPVPSPELRAISARFPAEGIVIGGWGWWSADLERSPHASGGSGYIYVGQKKPPILDFACAGSFPNLRTVVTIDGQTWWTSSGAYASRDGYEDNFAVQAPLWAPADTGTYVIAMTLDPDNRYPEIDDTNNSDTLVVRAILGNLNAWEIELDQTVSGIVVRADTVAVGTPVGIIVRSFCWGAFPSYRMRLEQNGVTLLDNVTSCESGIFPGSSNPELVWVAADPGVHTFTLTLDPEHEVRESDPGDNVATATLVVVP